MFPLFISLTRNMKQKRIKSQTRVVTELVGSPARSTSSQAAYSASHKTSASVSSGVTSGDSSDSTGSSERMRRNRTIALTNGSALSGEKWNIMFFNCWMLRHLTLLVTVSLQKGINTMWPSQLKERKIQWETKVMNLEQLDYVW